MGGDYFLECTQKTSRQVLRDAGVGDKLIDELATAIARCNYGQSADMLNGFTGNLSLLSLQSFYYYFHITLNLLCSVY